MSRRQLKKLRQQQELETATDKLGRSADSDDASDEPHLPAKARSNPFSGFAALAAGTDAEVADSNQDSGEEKEEETAQLEPNVASPVKKSKKSKKKKNKKPAPREDEPEATVKEDELDEIDKAIAELNLSNHAGAETSQDGQAQDEIGRHISTLLRINFHHLKALNEMRKLFGKEVMEAADAERDHPQDRQRGVQRQVGLEEYLQAPPGHGLPEASLRRSHFVDGKKTWPRASSGGLTMEAVSKENSEVVEYRFVQDRTYMTQEISFFSLVQTHDPMLIVHSLHKAPYHVSSLIQVSKVAKQDQNSALAADLCERALYTFGRVTLSSFRKKLEEGNARMDFYRPENRQFFLAGHNYIKNLIQKGTFRTALEWAKVFVSIAHDDPYGMMNWIHVLAYRAGEAQWFIDLCNSGLLSRLDSLGNAEYIKQSVIPAKLQLKDRPGAKADLVEGMKRLPWLYCDLFSALGVDAPPSVWGIKARSPQEELHTALYIHMARDIWNYPDTVALLREVGETLPRPHLDSIQLETFPITLGTARFVYLDNTPDLMSQVPRELIHTTPNFDFDPLPPPKQLNRFSAEWQEVPWQVAETDSLQSALRRLDLLPRPRARGADEDGHPANPAEELRDELQALVNNLHHDAPQDTDPAAAGYQGFFGRLMDRMQGYYFGGVEDEDADSDDGSQRAIPGAWLEEYDEWLDQEDDMYRDDFDPIDHTFDDGAEFRLQEERGEREFNRRSSTDENVVPDAESDSE